IGNAARALKLNLWQGDKEKAPVPNFRLQPMAEGLVIFTPEKDIFSPVRDRDLVNEAINRLFDFKANDEQIQWFRDAKFGMFIHWNPSSLLEREISWERNAARPFDSNSGKKNVMDFEYDSTYRRFNPKQYDPKKWMSVARKSGMKYAVLTSKHHDSFSNFPSAYDTFTIANTPYGKDIVGQFAAAVHAAGLKLGFYYSGRDWYNPYYLTNQHYRYLEYYFGQISELLTRYGQVDILWFDSLGSSSLNQWDPRTMIRRIKQYQPDILINNRMNGTRGGNKGPLAEDLKGDFLTPECKLGPFNDKTPWESCMTVADIPGTRWTGNWSYTSKAKVKPVEESIKFLINNTVKDGNLLYNIGPTPLGTFVPEQANTFLAMGKWIAPYREAIYGTRGGPYKNMPWGGSCYKTNRNGKKTVYLHVSPLIAQKGKELKGSEPLLIKDIGEKFTKATVIADGTFNGKEAKLEKEDGQYKITLPAGMSWDKWDTVIKLQ
ncbi:MAG: alpha-L-fucosidase, partial [Akkermansia sp.]